jgi:hypothetical protein
LNGEPATNGCLSAIQQNLFSLPPQINCSSGPPPSQGCTPVDTIANPLNATGLAFAQNVVSGVFAKYASNGFAIGSLPGTPGYNPFQDFLYSYVCCPYPFLCQQPLSNVCNVFTTQRLIFDPPAANWCGCFLPAGEYQTYVDDYQINKACTPMCNRNTNIVNTLANGTPISCNQNVCLIDNVTIDLIQSTVVGPVTIGQFCQGCEGSMTSCSCIIQNDSFEGANDQIGGGVNLTTTCTGSVCTRTNPVAGASPSVLNVDCGATAGYNPFPAYESQQMQQEEIAQQNKSLKIFIFIGIALILLFIAILIIQPSLSGRSLAESFPSTTVTSTTVNTR